MLAVGAIINQKQSYFYHRIPESFKTSDLSQAPWKVEIQINLKSTVVVKVYSHSRVGLQDLASKNGYSQLNLNAR